MKKYLRDLSINYWKTNSDDHKLEHYMHLREHPGWQVHKEFLIYLLQQIGNEMLSRKFTDMTPEIKDVSQRTYHNMAEVIKFLLDPTVEFKKQAKILQHNIKMTKGVTEKEQPKRRI